MRDVLSVVKVGVDVDGVLNRQSDACLQWFKAQGLVPEETTTDDITNFDFTRCLPGVTRQAVEQMFKEGVLHRAVPELPAVYQINRLKRAGAEVHLVTHLWLPGDKWRRASWLREAGVEYDHLAYVAGPDKGRYAQSRGLDFFIEDKFETALAVADRVRMSFLIDKPYNQSPIHHDKLRRFYAWHEIGQFFFGRNSR